MAKLAAAISLLLTLQLCCGASSHSYPPPRPSLISSERCLPDESIALLQFKNSFVGGVVNHDDDDKMATWKEGSDCCSWEGVTCDRFSSHVVGLHLGCDQVLSYAPCRRFQGILHPNSSLFHLRHLRSLDLSYNDFNGSTIPSTFTQLTSLTHLNLSRSRFSGHIPLGFSRLNKLVTLDLSYSWPDGDRERAVLSFGDNDDFSKLMLNATGLSELLLYGVSMSNIKPSSFSNLSHSMTDIGLSDSGLVGDFPESVFRLPNLQGFVLYENPQLSVQFPFSNWTASHLKVLILSSVNFSRQLMIPASIGDLKSLHTLYLDDCSLSGSVPDFIGNLTSLTDFSLRFNSLSGRFPDNIFRNLVQLEVLDLHSNKFSGWFPGTFGSLSHKLTYLDVSNNNFTGPIPSLIFNLPKLQILDCSYNQLLYLDLSYNMIEGPLSIPRSPQLQYLAVANNKLTGRMPHHICNLPLLTVINLSNNNLSGTIPKCLVNLTDLRVLQLRMNNFHGSVPSIFGNMSSLENLDLNDNTLGGPLPQSLTGCKELQVLDVGNNELNGVFPFWLSSLPGLKVLILHNNSFHGTITTESMDPMNSFPMLRILDISNNYFNGLLPASLFHKFPAMMMLHESEKIGVHYIARSSDNEYYSVVLIVKGQEMMITKILTIFTTVDLSNNNFHGSIPDAIGELKSLLLLNLSHNNFIGPIPSSLVNLNELEFLDLSSNQLTGEIPSRLASLTYLLILNLSRNSLQGQIPQGNQFLTFDNTSYIGNEGLCGPPLIKKCGGDHVEDSEPAESESDVTLFDWTFAGAGYGSGLVIGVSTAYIMFIIRKPRWLVEMIDNCIRRQHQARRWRPAIRF
ncbi:unnamed protein product [Linum trigynum]|uniref:Leucine-rich repeat-containing N-terminal plant-type domain-containing protein n=1 Tax=Linum trigynum TaxID=586398 RepID=A0AAV2GHR4_9ROSI